MVSCDLCTLSPNKLPSFSKPMTSYYFYFSPNSCYFRDMFLWCPELEMKARLAGDLLLILWFLCGQVIPSQHICVWCSNNVTLTVKFQKGKFCCVFWNSFLFSSWTQNSTKYNPWVKVGKSAAIHNLTQCWVLMFGASTGLVCVTNGNEIQSWRCP